MDGEKESGKSVLSVRLDDNLFGHDGKRLYFSLSFFADLSCFAIPNASTIIGIIITIIFHNFLVLWQGLSTCLLLFSLTFTLRFIRMAKSTDWQVLFFCYH